jgi:hypothetical protein
MTKAHASRSELHVGLALLPEQEESLYRQASKLGTTPADLVRAYVVEGLRFDNSLRGNLDRVAGEVSKLRDQMQEVRDSIRWMSEVLAYAWPPRPSIAIGRSEQTEQNTCTSG